MRILPIKNHQNQVSHKAVNQKFLKQARNEYMKYAPYHDQGHLLTMLEINEAYGLISTQDVVDTLEAIKPYAQNAIKVVENMIKRRQKTTTQ